MTKDELKILAKKLAETRGIKPTHAHEVIARSLGFKTYNAFLAQKEKKS